MRRGGVVKILRYLFDLFSEKLTKTVWKLSSWKVGRKRKDFGFTKQRVCNKEQLVASLAFCYLCVKVIGFSFQDSACHCIFFVCVKISLCTVRPDFRQDHLALRNSLLAARICGVNQGVIFFIF